MKRTDFAKIIEILAYWKPDGRKGNYRLPSGESLQNNIYDLIDEALTRYNAVITASGNIHKGATYDRAIQAYRIKYYSFTQSENVSEIIPLIVHCERKNKLAKEIVERRCCNYEIYGY